eukprot:868008-Prymnesium_polylepis.1
MCVSDRRAIEGGPRDDRNRAAERPLTWRAGPVTLPEPRRRPRTLPGPPGRLVVRPCFGGFRVTHG